MLNKLIDSKKTITYKNCGNNTNKAKKQWAGKNWIAVIEKKNKVLNIR